MKMTFPKNTMRYPWLFLVILLTGYFLGGEVAFGEKKILRCGLATGYPPYQFRDENGQPAGIDVEVAKLLGRELGMSLRFIQHSWDDVVTDLRLGRVDCICGMEINRKRKMMFDFTAPYYSRRIVVVTLAQVNIDSLEGLQWHVVAGDRHSYIEQLLERRGLKNKIRIHQTESKDMSMQLLKKGDVLAMIAPKAVAYFLAERHGVQIKVIEDSDPGSPVAIAVEKGNSRLLRRLKDALANLKGDGSMDCLFRKWNVDLPN